MDAESNDKPIFRMFATFKMKVTGKTVKAVVLSTLRKLLPKRNVFCIVKPGNDEVADQGTSGSGTSGEGSGSGSETSGEGSGSGSETSGGGSGSGSGTSGGKKESHQKAPKVNLLSL